MVFPIMSVFYKGVKKSLIISWAFLPYLYKDIENIRHAYLIIPLFAFANAGVVLTGMDISTVFSGVSLAIICGLVIGKVVGIFSFSWMAIKMRIVPMPHKSNWKMLMSVAMLGGIGFTVSMFIANLSFGAENNYNAELLNQSKLGIVVGSIVSGVLGYMLLRINLPKENELEETNEEE